MAQPRYVTDEAGKRVAVLLDIEEYEKLLIEAATKHPAVTALRNAPIDDEPFTEEDRKAVEEAEEDIRAGHIYSHEDVRQRILE